MSMALTTRDVIRFKAHCLCYHNLRLRSSDLDDLLLGKRFPSIEIKKILLVYLSALKSRAEYTEFSNAMHYVLEGLRSERANLESTFHRYGLSPETTGGVLQIYDDILKRVDEVVQEGDWDHLGHINRLRAVAGSLTKDLHGDAMLSLPEVNFEMETYEKVPGRLRAPAAWYPRENGLVILFDPMNFPYDEYLCIPFFLFHEYASHILPLAAADCDSRTLLLNGWLLGAQYECYQCKCNERAYEPLNYSHFNALEPYLQTQLQDGCANHGFRLATWFFNVIADIEPAKVITCALVTHACAYEGVGDFHLAFCKKLGKYKHNKKPLVQLKEKIEQYTTIDELFESL